MNRARFFFAICLLGSMPAHAAVEQISETFDGDDFDNPGWRVHGDAKLENGGYTFVNEETFLEPAFDKIDRDISGHGSFVSRAVFRDLDLGEVEPLSSPGSIGEVSIFHQLGPRTAFLLSLRESRQVEDAMWSVDLSVSRDFSSTSVPRSDHLSLELTYNDRTKAVTVEYVDLSEDISYSDSLELGGRVEPSHFMFLEFSGIDDGKANGILDHYELFPIPDIPGDFNGNDVLDSGDVDLLSQEVRAVTDNRFFDANEDGVVDAFDRTFWVHTITNTFFDDANLDGQFNSGDLVAVFQAVHHEDGSMAGWAAGDWNGDAEFTSNDLVVAFQDGGYEAGPRAAASAVPEPTWGMLLAAELAGIVMRQRKRGISSSLP